MDFPANPREKPGYRLEFADEFDGTRLDTGKWFPYMLPHWSDPDTAAARYTLSDGSLKLRIDRDQGSWCVTRPDYDRASNLQTGHFSGPVGSTRGQFRFNSEFRVRHDLPPVRTYTPQCGFFEVRLKAVPVPGYHVALWTIGYDHDQAGEIRLFEIHGHHITPSRSRIDYGVLRWDDPDLRNECYEDDLDLNAADYHVYAIDWTPEGIDFLVDNVKLRTLHQSPRYPMQFMLGVYERPHELTPDSATAPWPQICEVDYFRGYRPVA
jgi:hypothetical protein